MFLRDRVVQLLAKVALAVCLISTLAVPEFVLLWAFLAIIPLTILIYNLLSRR